MSQWKKGQSGNPNGRPKKGQALTEILAELGNLEGAEGKTRAELLAEALWQKALEGDLVAIKYIYDRIDGTPKTTVGINEGLVPKLITIDWHTGQDT